MCLAFLMSNFAVDITVQLVKSCEQIGDLYITTAGDIKRSKVQLCFEFDPLLLNKGSTIIIKKGVISHTAKVLNITIESSESMQVLPKPMVTGLSLGDLTWPKAVKLEKEEGREEAKQGAAKEAPMTSAQKSFKL